MKPDLHVPSPVCGEVPRLAWLGQHGAALRAHAAALLRCSRVMGRSGLFTTNRPGCTPCTTHAAMVMLEVHSAFHIRDHPQCAPGSITMPKAPSRKLRPALTDAA